MKNMKRKLVISVIAVAVIAGSTLGVPRVSAAPNAQAPETIIEAFAKKFGLKVSDVESVFESEQTKRQKERLALFEERLTAAVKDGKLTEAQKKYILEKHTQRQKERQEFQQWIRENNIDPSVMMGRRGMH